jgi:hypothetical protein
VFLALASKANHKHYNATYPLAGPTDTAEPYLLREAFGHSRALPFEGGVFGAIAGPTDTAEPYLLREACLELLLDLQTQQSLTF